VKEISYANANGYPAGELKHGVIALIGPDCPTIACSCNLYVREKLISNLMEIKARRGPVVAIVPHGSRHFDHVADALIEVPDAPDHFAAIPTTVALQLLAYYIAKRRGITEIDQPRNLAKSVTVE
jgi:glutamine---fructose-6-phosphate transaminase (isomerizing)